jgi:mannose/fructose/N-acetylgalactosamine-specific phosphotransferase system component IIC
VAETVTIQGQGYLKREPLGVLGLSFITLGIYFFVWYYKINDEIRRFENDQSISPTRSLLAIIFGWIIIVPPFIAMYNTAKHIQAVEQRLAIQPQLEPALVIVIMLFVSIGNGVYIQEHLNRVWDTAGGMQLPAIPVDVPPVPPAPPPPI